MTPSVIRPNGSGPFLILCDHASNWIPPELDNLGLTAADLRKHIAWDIGAAGIAQELSSIFDSPAVLSVASRLVVDCNRHLTATDLIPEQSDGTAIPGNLNISSGEKAGRIDRWFNPYHAAVESILEDFQAKGDVPILLSVHSMTENMAGNARPWPISLSSNEDRTLAERLLEALRRPGDIEVGDNQPYDMDPKFDFSVPFHALRRNLRYIQVEFRQDEVGESAAQILWARRFADAITASIL